MKKKILSVVILCVGSSFLVACATPKILLYNPKNGQKVICGGGSTGSIAGGMIGYQIQKKNDEDCKAAYLAQGFQEVTE